MCRRDPRCSQSTGPAGIPLSSLHVPPPSLHPTQGREQAPRPLDHPTRAVGSFLETTQLNWGGSPSRLRRATLLFLGAATGWPSVYQLELHEPLRPQAIPCSCSAELGSDLEAGEVSPVKTQSNISLTILQPCLWGSSKNSPIF